MTICVAVRRLNPQQQSGEMIKGIPAWYSIALKLFFPICCCIAEAIFGFLRCLWRARTSVHGGASMEVEEAGLMA
jgi:hypothetical protein